jgi:hypothetical protein
LEPAEDLLGGATQDVRVIEASPEQEEERVERERQEDGKSACGGLHVHRTAVVCGVVRLFPSEGRPSASVLGFGASGTLRIV